MSARPVLSIDAQVVLLGLLNATLVAAGCFFQKLNASRSGSVIASGWLVAAAACLVPTFWVGNVAYAIGGRISVFVPVSAATYVLTALIGRIAFGEALGWDKLAGCLFILAGVLLIARS